MTRQVVGLTMVLITAVTAGGLALGQQRGLEPGSEPGHPSPSRVWINNHDPSEAIPVTVTEASRISLAPNALVQTQSAVQLWSYRSIITRADADMAQVLASAGAEGWEAVGLSPAPSAPNGPATPSAQVVILLKRPAR